MKKFKVYATETFKVLLQMNDLLEKERLLKEDERTFFLNNELDEREHYKGRGDNLVQREKEMNEKENKWKERENKWNERENKWIKRENKWNEREEDMNYFTSQSKIKINIGGELFTTSKTTLLQYKGSYFESFATTDDSEIFVDRDPKYFSVLLNYLRDGKIRNSDLKHADLEDLQDEFEYFNIPFPLTSLLPIALDDNSTLRPPEKRRRVESNVFEGGTLLAASLQDVIKNWLPSRRFGLLYKATRDGFESDHFHKNCDDKGATLTIIKSKNGYLFGGYSPLPWDSTSGRKFHTDSFLFTLTNPHSLPPTNYLPAPGSTGSIFCHAVRSVMFGCGGVGVADICVFAVHHGIISFPHDYVDTSGRGQSTFTGDMSFTTGEVEVYSVI